MLPTVAEPWDDVHPDPVPLDTVPDDGGRDAEVVELPPDEAFEAMGRPVGTSGGTAALKTMPPSTERGTANA